MADNEKVIKGLECCENRHVSCVDCPYYIYDGKGHKWCSDEINRDALELLKEQKPKPVRYEENTFTKLPVSFCPKCGEHIDMYLYGRPDNSVKFCPYCGQAVDWIEDGEQE